MGEIKHNFTAGKMNKDLDERLVPQGQYRDANNIQVRTTSGDGDGDGEGDGGVVQNIQGNHAVGSATGDVVINTGFSDTDFKCVGSISDEKTDNSYYLFTSGIMPSTGSFGDENEIVKIDTIIEHNAVSGLNTPVVVDRWGMQTPIVNVWGDGANGTPGVPSIGDIVSLDGVPELADKVRVNDEVILYNANNLAQQAQFKIKRIGNNGPNTTLKLYDQVGVFASWSSFTHARFLNERVLKFDNDTLVNGINIIDDLLFWTDGETEPKKINITRAKRGTPIDGNSHTQLFVTDPVSGALVNAGTNELNSLSGDLLEEHVTVLRPAPTTPPTIHTETRDAGELQFLLDDFAIYDPATGDIALNLFQIYGQPTPGNTFIAGYNPVVDLNYGTTSLDLSSIQLEPGDIFLIKQEDVDEGFTPIFFKAEFISYMVDNSNESDVPTSLIKFSILTEPNLEVDPSMVNWNFQVIDLDKSKFELKFSRFGYRYKYEDGEYSAFSPWSELAFDPGVMDYDPVKGYNKGMVNTIKKLIIKDFIPYYTDRALDITEVEILYKATDSANVYTIKSIKKRRDGEWELFSPNGTLDVNNDTLGSIETGAIEIKSETIHRVVPSNQMLRAYDNVPRYALAQEITGSRILYGNFVQGFDLEYPVGLNQHVKSESVERQPKQSVKTIRDYKVGMVFGDKYGRETPVIVSNKITDANPGYYVQTDDLSIPKELCAQANTISVKQVWDKPGLPGSSPASMSWMEYVKYYVKETTNEYYNLVLDRWYNAKEEENIWLSFLSADRNKVDLETYLVLKKSHGSGDAVLEKARYKIIDIQNEAPDFIKTDQRIMGLVDISNNVGALDPNVNQASELVNAGNTSITVDTGAFDNFLDSYGENMRGQLFVRVIGRTENPTTGFVFDEIISGDWKKVTHHHTTSSPSGTKIVYDSPFLESGDMLQRFTTAGYEIGDLNFDGIIDRQLKYYFQFKEDVVENRPEFDGRFFALIEKDQVTEEQVQIVQGVNNNYIEIATYNISYVDSQRYNPAQQGPYSMGDNTGTSGAEYRLVTGSDGGEGLYDNYDINSGSGGNITDPTQPCEWWGWGTFSESIPMSGYSFANTNLHTDGTTLTSNFDSRQVTYFALGCSHLAYANTDRISSGFGGGGSHVANYAYETYDYWYNFKAFHLAKNNGGYDRSIDPRDVANATAVYLDGARANRVMIPEYGTDPSTTTEQGIMDIDGDFFFDNDGVAGAGSVIGLNPPPSIFNYKPTALDQGHAASGLGRMVLSQNRMWDGEETFSPGSDSLPFSATTLYTHITTTGTNFTFVGDTSETYTNPDGSTYPGPRVYRIIGEDVSDPSISLMPQRYGGVHATKNFGQLQAGGEKRDRYIASNFGVATGNGGGDFYDINFGGANADSCVDFDGNPIDCFAISGTPGLVDFSNDTVGEVYGSGVWPPDNTPAINIGTIKNDSSEMQQWTRQGRCKNCGSNSDFVPFGNQGWGSEGDMCGRNSVRFEFRRVDIATDQVTNEGIDVDLFDPRGQAKHDGTAGRITIQIRQLTSFISNFAEEVEEDKSVWETEPKEDVGLDLYYEASHALPVKLKKGNTLAFAPLKSQVLVEKTDNNTGAVTLDDLSLTVSITPTELSNVMVGGAEYRKNNPIIKVISTDVVSEATANHINGIGVGSTMVFRHTSGLQTRAKVVNFHVEPTGNNVTYVPQVGFTKTATNMLSAGGGTSVTLNLNNENNLVDGMNITGVGVPPDVFLILDPGLFANVSDHSWLPYSGDLTFTLPTGYYEIDRNVYKNEVDLGWFNCYSFGNGVESDRIRDDFNAPMIDNGVRVSTTIEDYGQEDKTSGLIFSGLYNSISGVNDLNEFNMGENIIKNLNPEYGSVQALKTRDTDVVAFCEDRILKVQANKEAVFMADNDPNIVATDRVLGTVSTFKGDYGISKNPESLASDTYRLYFTDSQRGAVIRISMDGITPISNVGMKTWFRENIKNAGKLLGTFDKVNGEYNLTITPGTTISFNEGSKGWVSFKSFVPDQGVSVAGKYFTVKNGTIYEHYSNTSGRNLFYGAEELSVDAESTLTVMFNNMPGTVKSFKAMNYEGSQARIDQNLTDNNYYNVFPDKKGWWVSDIETDLQEGKIYWFVSKENKWFNKICGTQTTLDNLDTKEFTVQGIGKPTFVEDPTAEQETYTLTIQND
tara:strand:+ start:3042 stop:9566 length:6525 start_codon:yes stop_codon:yes gene_type:complete